MRTRTRTMLGLLVVAVLVLPAMPAAADTTGTGTFSGNMAIGKWFASTCNKDGVGDPTGRGLYMKGTTTIPGVANGDDTREEDGVWRLTGTGNATGNNQGGAFAGTLALALCGHLGPIVDPGPNRFDGIGANCLLHKGHHGKGVATFANGQMVKLYDVGWKIAVGGWVPFTGRYQEYVDDSSNPNTAQKKQKFGTVVGLALLQGGAGCLGLKNALTNNGNGAQQAAVVGTIKFVNTAGVEPPTVPKATQKHCKNSGPAARVGADGKKSHENKPGRHPCTAADGGDK